MQLATTGVVTYVVDCHREKAGEAFATMNCLKNLFAFGLTFYMNGWIASQGVRRTFFTIGGITVGVTLLTVPMYVSHFFAFLFLYFASILICQVYLRQTLPKLGPSSQYC